MLPGNILLVDRFLNQGLDIQLLQWLGQDIAKRFSGKNIDLVLTIEASGIAIAVATASALGVNAAFAKKHESINLSGELWTSRAYSYTKQREYQVALAKKILNSGMRVLIVDDFLARGMAMGALIELVQQADAEVAGIAVAIEKHFQDGGEKLREAGFDLYSAVRVKSLKDGTVDLL